MVKKIPLKEPKDGATKKFKNQIRRLEKEVRWLKSELRTYELAFEKTEKFLEGQTGNISLEDLIEAANKRETVKEVKAKIEVRETCNICLSSDVKKLPTRFGYLKICHKCGEKEVINECTSNDGNDDGNYSQ